MAQTQTQTEKDRKHPTTAPRGNPPEEKGEKDKGKEKLGRVLGK
jgi:hypothetical protein